MDDMESIKLNRKNLHLLKQPVTVPSYKNDLIPSIIHIGLGHFHRAHQSAYLDELLNRRICNDGVTEINLIPDSFPIAEILEKQDYLYTLITKSPGPETEVHVIGTILNYINAARNRGQAIARTADEKTKLITLTVTEGGYYFDKKTHAPNVNEEAVKWDLSHPDDPKTAPGFLAAVLAKRFRENKKPLTIMCCDNVFSNGEVLHSSVMFFCREHHKEIISWIDDNVSFPSSMVDRITPGTTPALIEELEKKYGIIDGWPVCGEDFIQWVLEDNFKTKVPDYDLAGVQIVKDVGPYEMMKMRLLNGSHMALAYQSYLLGCRLVDDAITQPLVKKFIRNYFMEEAGATLLPVPGIDVNNYKDILVSRFSNKNISDTVLRLCSQGSSKIPTFIYTSLTDTIKKNLPHSALCFAIATWARFLSGKDESGNEIPIVDVSGDKIYAAAADALRDPKGFFITTGLQNLNDNELGIAAECFKKHLENISKKGMKTALEEFLRS